MEIYEVLEKNHGVLGVDDVADALHLDPDELAEWADDCDVARVEDVRVFQRKDVDLLLADLEDEDGDDGEDEDGDDGEDEDGDDGEAADEDEDDEAAD